MVIPHISMPELPVKTLAQFLESVPPNSQVQISDLFVRASNPQYWVMRSPDIQLHCNSDPCAGTRPFRRTDSNYLEDGWNFEFSMYVCRNCEQSRKTFALAAFLPTDRTKIGK